MITLKYSDLFSLAIGFIIGFCFSFMLYQLINLNKEIDDYEINYINLQQKCNELQNELNKKNNTN